MNFQYASTSGGDHLSNKLPFEFFTVMGHSLSHLPPLFTKFNFSVYRTTILTQGEIACYRETQG